MTASKDVVPYEPTIEELWDTYNDFARQEQVALHDAEIAHNRNDDEAVTALWRAYELARLERYRTHVKIKERTLS